MAFTGRCTITPQTGQVPSSQSNYAVLVSVTNAALKSTGNGGQVQSTSGFDIRAYSDVALTTALKFYLTFYAPTTGELRMWVKIPTIAANSPYYLGFGDSSLTTNGSDGPNTFSNSYSGVWPFENGSSLITTDITDEEFNATNNGAVAGTAILNAGALLDGTNDYLKLATHVNVGTSLTLTSMIKSGDLSQIKVIWSKRSGMTGESGSGNKNTFFFYTTAAAKLLLNINTNNVDQTNFNNANLTGATTLSADTIYVVHARYIVNGEASLWINGTKDANTATWAGEQAGGTQVVHFGDDGTAGRFFNGTFRNFQYSGAARPDDWIKTDANCWLAPSTFATYVFDTIAATRVQAMIFG